MKVHHSPVFFILLLITFQSHYSLFAQTSPSPSHPFSASLNTVGILNFDAIATLEYRASDHMGIFLGGGISAPIVEAGNIRWFPKSGINTQAGGLKAGVRWTPELGTLTGFSLKPFLAARWMAVQPDSAIVPPIPQTVDYLTREWGAYLSLAYTKSLGNRFFIEPSVGLGAMWGKFTNGAESQIEFLGLGLPLELNLGFRF